MSGGFWGVGVLPAASAPITCPCLTNAGAIPGGPVNICNLSKAVVSSAAGVFLQNNDILRYLLISDPSDIINFILAVSTTPSFPFNPATMSIGTTYYIVAVAGNNLNGNIDFNDPCLSFSNLIPVTWRPLPSVAFSVDSPDFCAGECRTVTATLTGTAPFSLTYTTPFGTFTQSFDSNTGTFPVCAPAGTPAGTLTVQAKSLTGAWCACL